MVGPAIVAFIGLLLIALVVVPFGKKAPAETPFVEVADARFEAPPPLGCTEAQIMAGLEGAWSKRELDFDDEDWGLVSFLIRESREHEDRERVKFAIRVTWDKKLPDEATVNLGERAVTPMIAADKRFISNVVGEHAPAAIAWVESYLSSPTEPESATRRFGPFNVTAGHYSWPKRCWVAIERAADSPAPVVGG